MSSNLKEIVGWTGKYTKKLVSDTKTELNNKITPLQALGLTVINGVLCQTYTKED